MKKLVTILVKMIYPFIVILTLLQAYSLVDRIKFNELSPIWKSFMYLGIVGFLWIIIVVSWYSIYKPIKKNS